MTKFYIQKISEDNYCFGKRISEQFMPFAVEFEMDEAIFDFLEKEVDYSIYNKFKKYMHENLREIYQSESNYYDEDIRSMKNQITQLQDKCKNLKLEICDLKKKDRT
jgi:hypothetical protein